MIGKETRAQCLEQFGGAPDILLACVGGGSNAIGLFHEFVDEKDVSILRNIRMTFVAQAWPSSRSRIAVLRAYRLQQRVIVAFVLTVVMCDACILAHSGKVMLDLVRYFLNLPSFTGLRDTTIAGQNVLHGAYDRTVAV